MCAKSCGYEVNNPDQVKKAFLTIHEDRKEVHKELIRNAEKPTYRNYNELPFGHRWPSQAGFTRIGDAAHLVSPCAGEGVNIAMMDALRLSEAIVSAAEKGMADTLARKVCGHEDDVFRRADETKEQTTLNKNAIFHENAPQILIGGYMKRQGLIGRDNEWLMETTMLFGYLLKFWT
ncbi:MAG: hypothetical protein Q9170_004931 [Blastenia crenularia]